MSRRAQERRQRENRRLWTGLAIAVGLHVAALGLVRWSGSGPEWSPDHDTVTLESNSWTGTPVDAFFGPPKIFRPDGTIAEEPPDRVLKAARLLGMPPTCLSREVPPSAPGSGQVRLTVNAIGRIEAVSLDRSTGDSCWDAVAIRVAGDLWYHWLPNERFPAPVELLQPITVGLAQD